MDKTNKIIYNTGIVYLRLIITTIISLLSVRFVLQALGEEDYGVYMLVAGVVAIFDILSITMSNTSMRFMAHSLGKNNLDISLKTFNTTLFIHYCLAFLVVAILEIGGWVMFEWFLNIPDEKLFSAKILYQFMVVTALVTIVSVPFDAIINAHENLFFLSVVKVFQTVAVLIAAIITLYFSGDRLIFYGFLIMTVNIIARIVKQIYTRRKYGESKVNFRKYRDKEIMRSILSFTGWDFLNSFSAICSIQLRGLLINMFFGVRLNAAEGIGKNVNAKLNMVSTGITSAITPQMNKSAGGGDNGRLIQLTFTGVKYTTFMYCILAVPLMLEMQYVLEIWLGEVPAYTALFCQMCILIQMVNKFTWQITNAVRAVGRIKEMQIAGTIITFSGVVIGYFFFKAGAAPVSIYLIELFLVVVGIFMNLYFGRKIVGILPVEFLKKATLPVILPVIIALAITLPVHFYVAEGFARLMIVFVVFILSDSAIFWFKSMTESERVKIKSIVKNKIH